ncbi:MAG: hypothetical protein IPO03_03375 [Bacteroidetes bacterium]|nr:hypothetical protein [Bacteroidota bacterium]
MMSVNSQPAGKIAGGEMLYYEEGKNPVDLSKIADNYMRHYRGNKIGVIFQELHDQLPILYLLAVIR